MKNHPLASGKQDITPEHPMKVQFLGAAQTVTGSCYMIEACGKRFCIDCGMHQGNKAIEERNRNPRPYAPGNIDFILVTHAHIDHSGLLPLMVREGFSKPIYCTKATSELLDIMLQDSAHIQEMEAQWEAKKYSRRGLKNPPAALYTTEDALKTAELLHPVAYHEDFEPAPGIKVTYYDAGHILGSGSLRLEVTEDDKTTSIIFSGDIGRPQALIVRDPESPPKADYIFMESTYGDRNHKDEDISDQELADAIAYSYSKGEKVIIPAFAVGRTQEMLYAIREIKQRGLVTGHDHFPVYVDSPLAVEATGIFLQCDPTDFDDETRAILKQGVNPIWFDGLKLAVSSDESKLINTDPQPKVILSASGMCEAGRIRHHLKHNLWRKESVILFVGYQAEGSLGWKLENGAKSVKLFGEDIAVNAEIAMLHGTSGHADKEGLLNWLAGFREKPKMVFVNHGDDGSCKAFCATLKSMGYHADAPYSGTEYDLITGKLTTYTEGVKIDRAAAFKGTQRAKQIYEDMVAAAEALLALVKTRRGNTNKDNAKLTGQIISLIEKWKK